ncbi:flagellar protein FlhE [Pseudomonas oryzae]|uniref:Flagellar protein FlhE n=1 Tax=Pseudomonas oryzae TaxID=1392877 RepID=A0A1H1NTQ9_9PSED|nr:flagellar protein FlhE [Pseudomonas oryzae]
MLRRLLALALLGSLLGAAGGAPAQGAPGSWQGRAPALLVARSDQRVCSEPLPPPPLASGQRLASLAWQFSVPAGAPLRAWLCHPQQCLALPASRGRSRALGGLDAGQPLQLCFLLDAGGRPQRVADLQVLVEYR